MPTIYETDNLEEAINIIQDESKVNPSGLRHFFNSLF